MNNEITDKQSIINSEILSTFGDGVPERTAELISKQRNVKNDEKY